jgi:hypothetical protein
MQKNRKVVGNVGYKYYSDNLPGVTGDPTYVNRLRAVFDNVTAGIYNGDFDNMVHGQGQVFAAVTGRIKQSV